jgi:acyl-coenzyme A thioesterase PaaI-like protein
MSLHFEQVKVGLTLSAAHAFTASELDSSPDRVLTASLLSKVSGGSFRNSSCSGVSLNFLRPARPGEVISVAAEVTHVRPSLRSVGMKVRLTRNGDLIAKGKFTTHFI